MRRSRRTWEHFYIAGRRRFVMKRESPFARKWRYNRKTLVCLRAMAVSRLLFWPGKKKKEKRIIFFGSLCIDTHTTGFHHHHPRWLRTCDHHQPEDWSRVDSRLVFQSTAVHRRDRTLPKTRTNRQWGTLLSRCLLPKFDSIWWLSTTLSSLNSKRWF
jgi:hypothetical protein